MSLRSSLTGWSAKPARRVNVDGRAAAPLLLSGIAIAGTAAVLLNRTGLFHKLFGTGEDSLTRAHRLARAIVGNTKHSVSAVLGSPQASAGCASPQAVFLAKHWYYRLDSRRHVAIAIEFENDVARDVRILHVQGAPRAFRSVAVPRGMSARA